MYKIGIFSGTFDPVHDGHIAFALNAIEKVGLDKVYFLVEPRPRRKQGVRALEHRQAMVDLAIAGYERLGSIACGERSFSVAETLPLLHKRLKGSELYFLLGEDVLHYFTDAAWPGLDDFLVNCRMVIGIRSGHKFTVEDTMEIIKKTRAVKLDYTTIETPHALHNSTQVREQLRKGLQPSGISAEVWKYITDHQLYSPVASSEK